jgi:hypothetical protein
LYLQNRRARFAGFFRFLLDESTPAYVNATEKPMIIMRSVDKEKDLPKETQMAQCTVTSGDIKASAQATFSKKLEGFCSTSEFNEKSFFPI